jgi:RNA polymerase sigma-70 factor (ECF subfamily)
VKTTAGTELQDRFMALFEQHRKIIFKVAGMYCWRAEDRLDLEQEITAQLWRSFPRFDSTRVFSTWMYRLALNVAISYVRVAGNQARRFVSLEDHGLDAIDPACRPGDLDEHEHDDRVRALNGFIAGLDGLNRALLLLYLDEQSYREIAEVLGISETNVATKINRLKARMRNTIGHGKGNHDGTR